MANLFICKLRQIEKGGRTFLYGEINDKTALVVTADAAYFADKISEQKPETTKRTPAPMPKQEPEKLEPDFELEQDDRGSWVKPGAKIPEKPKGAV